MTTLNISVHSNEKTPEYTTYKFTSRTINYSIVTRGRGTYDIWLKRPNQRLFNPPRTMTLTQMAEANKTLASFATWLTRG